jgi:hypothetical protein
MIRAALHDRVERPKRDRVAVVEQQRHLAFEGMMKSVVGVTCISGRRLVSTQHWGDPTPAKNFATNRSKSAGGIWDRAAEAARHERSCRRERERMGRSPRALSPTSVIQMLKLPWSPSPIRESSTTLDFPST